MKICFNCDTVFERHLDIGFEMSCPILNCYGDVVDIDDNIFHTIRTLNQKGYKTKTCCSGHTWEGSPFIVFDSIVDVDCFSFYPNGFVHEVNEYWHGVRKEIKAENLLEKQKALNEAAYDLIVWAENLPVANRLNIVLLTDLNCNKDEFVAMVEDKLNLVAISLGQEVDGEMLFEFDTITTPANTQNLVAKIESFAASENLGCEIEPEEYRNYRLDSE